MRPQTAPWLPLLRPLRLAICSAWALGLPGAACGDGVGTLEQVDPAGAPPAPLWSSDVRPIMAAYCADCHGREAQTGRSGGYGFETCDEVVDTWGPIRATALRTRTMPPPTGRRLPDWAGLTLQRWWDQGAPCD